MQNPKTRTLFDGPFSLPGLGPRGPHVPRGPRGLRYRPGPAHTLNCLGYFR